MEWAISTDTVDYPDALARMNARVTAIQHSEAEELVWLLEHPPLYTAGTSAKGADLLQTAGSLPLAGEIEAGRFPVYPTGRGGQYTYHGPGQRVAYILRDLKKHPPAGATDPDLRAYVKQLEHWLIATLQTFNIDAFTRDGRVGVWVATSTGEAKIAALGVRVQKWVTSHGIALNVHPDLSHYAGIVPCGIREFGVTSMHALGVPASLDAVDAALKEAWGRVFE